MRRNTIMDFLDVLFNIVGSMVFTWLICALFVLGAHVFTHGWLFGGTFLNGTYCVFVLFYALTMMIKHFRTSC